MPPPKKTAPKAATKSGFTSSVRSRRTFKSTITEEQIYEILGPRNPLVKRLLNADAEGGAWLAVVGQAAAGGEKGRLIDYESFRKAYKRLITGERPSPLRGECQTAEFLVSKDGAPTTTGSALLRALELLPRLSQSIIITPGRKSIVARWPDGTQEIYKAVRTRHDGKWRLVSKTYEPAVLACLDMIWSSGRATKIKPKRRRNSISR